jgi:hypothetical protein
MGTILVWATAWAFVALIARMVASPRRGASAGGRRLRAELDAPYGGEHEYQRVTPAAFPDADLGFYDRAAAELEALGFRRLADVEDLTVSRVYPERRTFLRVFVDEGATTRAAVYHMRVRGGGVAVLQWVGMAPKDLHLIELVSEVPRGHFLSTSNTKRLDRLSAPKEIEIERLEPSAPIGAVVARHKARLTEEVRRRPSAAPVSLWTFEEVMASVQRHHVALARHRQAVGGLSRDEIERVTGRPLTAAEEAFLHEVRGDEPEPRRGAAEARPHADERARSDDGRDHEPEPEAAGPVRPGKPGDEPA